MIERYLIQASTYAGDIDGLIVLIGWLVGVWFVISEGVFFWLIWKFRAKEGVKSEYLEGHEEHVKRWVTWPHALILVCDVFIILFAVDRGRALLETMPTLDRIVFLMEMVGGLGFLFWLLRLPCAAVVSGRA